MKHIFPNIFKQLRLFLWILLVASGTLIAIGSVTAADSSTLYDARGKRDPFVPVYAAAVGQSSGILAIESIDEVIVEGIVYDPKQGSIVIVNGTVLKEKEEAGNVKIVKIKPDGVLISVNGVEGFKSINQNQ